ncbi:hypothetical protein WH96_19640 [Kiloniella spongiae]|uniref:Uncharacterized protein n=1 Tax=Kiloniella spongiae TaxID=1489064 RepID=A0A0H2M985_9PROT|nr:hypothetical protein [Kiloniella spongiae]KLN59069.1 hypothetical protein WH96_19640 [Kiloniella spongiae]
MSTIGLESWAVDLAEVGPVYPFQGWEVAMTIVGVVFWLGWHRIQYLRENEHLKNVRDIGDKEKIAKALERY